MSDANTAAAYANPDSDTYTHTYAYTNADSHSHGNADAWPDHTNGVGTQSAGEAHGGSLLERSELGQHRDLP